MKIIGSIGSSGFIVEANEHEIANIMGFDYASEARDKSQKIEVGREVKVSALWKALHICRTRAREITSLAKGLRAQADAVDSINAALKEPIIEIKA